MSYSDLPEVDENSKTSEESVIAVKIFFSKKNGFISRDENPDYGVDIDVELVTENVHASSKKFPIQIKSASEFKTIIKDNEKFIKKSFLSSRLNYLSERSPAYGLIILYDEGNKTCYFEYVEQILIRLNLEKNQEWKIQESVTIYVPSKNVLSLESIKEIHSIFFRRFQAHALLLEKHGKEFEIPAFTSSSIHDKNDLKSLPIVELVKKYGLLFINSYDILLLYNLISQISFNELSVDKDLIYISSIVYSEIGKCVEAEFFLQKTRKIISQYDFDEQEVLKFFQIKVDFLLGKRDEQQFLKDLQSMKNVSKSPYNSIQITINVLYYTILQQIEKNDFDARIEDEILNAFTSIENLDLDNNKKGLLKIFHAENLQMYVSSLMLKWISNLRIRESLWLEVPVEEKIHMHSKSNALIALATSVVLEALKVGRNNNDKLIQAHAQFALGRFYLIKEYDFLLLHFIKVQPETLENFKRATLQSIHAANLFMEMGILRDARLAFINAFELLRLGKLMYEFDAITDNIREDIVLNNIHALEQEMGVANYESIVDSAYESYLKIKSKNSNEDFLFMPDDDINEYALTILNYYKLPEIRLINLISEMKAYRFFQKNCDTSKFELLSDLRHYTSNDTLYKKPSIFIIKNKISNIESLPDSDIERLASNFGALK